MKNKKAILLMWLLALAPIALVALYWGKLPDLVPIHWGANGQVDNYAAKGSLWWLCGISPALALLFQFLPKLDPKKENYRKFQGTYDLVCILFPCIMLFVMWVTISEALNPGGLSVGRLVMGAVSVIFIITGNIMGKIKTNWFMGFRTPWALSDPDVWVKTNRMGGWVFFLAGLVTLILCFFAPEEAMVISMIGIFVVGTVLTYYMSWKWFRDKTHPPKD